MELPAEASQVKIMVTSDNHLGYQWKDPLRKYDSFNTFEETLIAAKKHNVDMVFLAGDLFHENNPNQEVLNHAVYLFRKYCFGERPSSVRIRNKDITKSIASPFQTINYMDPNINVSIPVFLIHGNHDDPMGNELVSVVDVLSNSGLVNYIGKIKREKEAVHPVLLQKGETKIALYGLGNLPDSRMKKMLTENKITFVYPGMSSDWFNVLLFHQNRLPKSNNYIPEELIPGLFDIVIWGHEHDCLIVPEENQARQFHVIQPGSTVETSVPKSSTGFKKSYGILTITNNKFKMDRYELCTIRPYVYEQFLFSEDDMYEQDIAEDLVVKKLDQMVQRGHEIWTDQQEKAKQYGIHHPVLDTKPLPLVYLEVGCKTKNLDIRKYIIEPNMVDKIANPRDSIHIQRKKQQETTSRQRNIRRDEELLTIIEDAFKRIEFVVLPEAETSVEVTNMVLKGNKDAFESFANKILSECVFDEELSEHEMKKAFSKKKTRTKEMAEIV